ncbi:hypothetical protein [Flammeovirga kamogawensis]|uniref:Uncharacterized protein n=1 Tax=Flammeovirga kamogawensis TaxID=373891 RepID=A0ABX8GRU6_9BACT|nr:hypothetical protein [Flammeovirga kamogawensis]MBB6463248.1 hypothetical protein [Flammeovirga kamogawensis]QWG05902.1 hypothetical protein KM029_11030 [Flammeovirga kamogawensis]TRX67727.1 hypothetical protein EO216_06040 [Flammeovirga kamogawensis]
MRKSIHTFFITSILILSFSNNIVLAQNDDDKELALAITIDSAVYHESGDVVDYKINYDVFTQRVFQKLHRNSSDWKDYIQVFKEQLRLGDLLVEQIGNNGEYAFVKILEDDKGDKTLLYRVLKGDGWLDYNEMLLAQNHYGAWQIIDIYFYSGGAFFSDVVATMLADENPDLVTNKIYQESLLRIREMYDYNQQGLYGNTLISYDSLSNYFKKQKSPRLALIQAQAAQGNLSELEILKDKYLIDYPYDKSIRLLMSEVYGAVDNYELSKLMLDELSDLIGGDDYLLLREAEIFLSWQKEGKSKKILKKLIKSEIYQTEARLLLLDVYYAEENYKNLLDELLKVSDEVGVAPKEILSEEQYHQFYISSYWLKYKKN